MKEREEIKYSIQRKAYASVIKVLFQRQNHHGSHAVEILSNE